MSDVIKVSKMPNGEYCAVSKEWDLGDPQGWGKTPDEAVADLEQQLEEKEERANAHR